MRISLIKKYYVLQNNTRLHQISENSAIKFTKASRRCNTWEKFDIFQLKEQPLSLIWQYHKAQTYNYGFNLVKYKIKLRNSPKEKKTLFDSV